MLTRLVLTAVLSWTKTSVSPLLSPLTARLDAVEEKATKRPFAEIEGS
jgi:hypothetical protein